MMQPDRCFRSGWRVSAGRKRRMSKTKTCKRTRKWKIAKCRQNLSRIQFSQMCFPPGAGRRRPAGIRRYTYAAVGKRKRRPFKADGRALQRVKALPGAAVGCAVAGVDIGDVVRLFFWQRDIARGCGALLRRSVRKRRRLFREIWFVILHS